MQSVAVSPGRFTKAKRGDGGNRIGFVAAGGAAVLAPLLPVLVPVKVMVMEGRRSARARES